jgi:hypothetical protein
MPPNPEQPDFYSQPTQASPYTAWSEDPEPQQPVSPRPPAPEPPPPKPPWYRTAPALVAAGALGVLVLAALIFAVVKLASGPSGTATTTTPSASTSAPASSSAAPAPGGGADTSVITQAPQTITATNPPSPTDTGSPAAPSTDTGTPAAPSTDTGTTSVAPPTDTSTVTQTVTVPRLPFFPRPGGQ